MRQMTFIMDEGCEDLTPTRKHDDDTGWDIRAKTDGHLKPGEFGTIPTGLRLELPVATGAQVRGRSGLAANGTYVVTGTIDNGYRGEIGVNIHTLNPEGFSWMRGDRIAQLVMEIVMDWKHMNSASYRTHRGSNGFGSSGVK